MARVGAVGVEEHRGGMHEVVYAVRQPVPGLQNAQLVDAVARLLMKLVCQGLPGILGMFDVPARLDPQVHFAVFVHQRLPLLTTNAVRRKLSEDPRTDRHVMSVRLRMEMWHGPSLSRWKRKCPFRASQ